jgi:anthranilate synthase component 1
MNCQAILDRINTGDKIKLDIVSATIPADLETPVSAFLKLRGYGAKILLESVESGTILGRYSFIGMKSAFRITIDSKNTIIYNGSGSHTVAHPDNDSPLLALKNVINCMTLENAGGLPRLLGGAVGYISYDFVRFFEPIPKLLDDSLNLPLAMFHMIDTLLVFDHIQRQMKILCLTDDESKDEADEKLTEIKKALTEPLDYSALSAKIEPGKEPVSNFTEQEFCQAVREVKEHIIAGNVYQQVISQRLHGRTKANHFNVYRALRMLNPSPYMYFLDFDDVLLIGSSPEALVRFEDGLATVRPIAGTRPRGKNEAEDRKLGQELFDDAKERAEHVMLVDLGRNDLGRCCLAGTVKVTDFMTIERYSHVMHLTSNVVGQPRPGTDQFDLFKMTFPAGTVTGAPKIRSMQLIEEIEKTRRGPYAGAVGYFSLTGDMDWCINIRTIVMKGQDYYLQAGAGIVADSVPEKEYQETQNKIAALRKAIETAERGLL